VKTEKEGETFYTRLYGQLVIKGGKQLREKVLMRAQKEKAGPTKAQGDYGSFVE